VLLEAEPAGRPQSWRHCDPDIAAFVEGTVRVLEHELGPDLTGVYLHGSLAMGSYFRPKSDIDLLAVVERPLPTEQRRSIARSLAAHMRIRPIVGDLELSVITAQTARAVPVPVPYQVHVSGMWGERILSDEVSFDGDFTDPDLPAHLTHVRQRGITLVGPPICDAFGEIAWDGFVTAVEEDSAWVLADGNLLQSPLYGILNVCRVLQLRHQRDRQVHSKDEAARWALAHLPPTHHNVVRQAWTAYRSEAEVASSERQTAGLTWPGEDLRNFRDFARSELGLG